MTDTFSGSGGIVARILDQRVDLCCRFRLSGCAFCRYLSSKTLNIFYHFPIKMIIAES